ncbi:MAG TPA: serine/threonine-protein kinase [Kofleriaceae bacterium]|nr:serine/threonine-protein kinase [Kofleriaceae bacterium]
MAEPGGCLDENVILDLVQGALAGRAAEAVGAHVDGCAHCRELVAAIFRDAADSDTLLAIGSDREPKGRRADVLAAGAVVGRYRIERLVGSGAMGMVYAARDPELDRMVALKLIRPERRSAELEARLRRESQALARLQHPNVTAVHDVGSIGGDVFVAMELVPGETLRQWLDRERRSWREVLAVFRQAGAGLAAAHAAGLVHRDFKPENVLLDGGRAVVTDFGLARAPAEIERQGLAAGSDHGADDPGVTATGLVVGTPAYMAPEQFEGKAIGARADQFAFAVALHEALHGERPFAGDSVAALWDSIRRWDLRPPPADRRVPRWLRAVVLRGLSRAPEDRFRDMGEMVTALAGPRRRTIKLAAAVGAALLGGGVAVGLALGAASGGGARGICSGDDRFREVWSGEAREAVRARFASLGARFAGGAFAAIDRDLADYGRRWRQVRTHACEETRVRGTQSEELLDRRMVCLDDRLSDVRALVTALARADRAAVSHPEQVVGALPGLAACDDKQALLERAPMPHDERLRARIGDARRLLGQARALEATARYPEALALADRAAAESARIGYRPLEAEAQLARGSVLELMARFPEAEKALLDAAFAAEAGREGRIAADAWTRLMFVVGVKRAETARGEEYDRHARAAIERLGGDDELEGQRLSHLGIIRFEQGRRDDARLLYLAAIERMSAALGTEHEVIASLHDRLGDLVADGGDLEEANRHSRIALALREKKLGPDHPSLAAPIDAIAGRLIVAGRSEEAMPLLDRALAIQTAALGPEHDEIAVTLALLGMAETPAHPDKAIAYLERALAIQETSLGPDHPDTVLGRVNLGAAYVAAERFAEALAQYDKAIAATRARHGERHADLGTYEYYRGDALRMSDRPREAIEAYTRALAILEPIYGRRHPDVGALLMVMGEAWGELEDWRRAESTLREAVAINDAVAVDPTTAAETRFYLAQVLWQGGRGRAEAVDLARRAAAVYRASRPDDPFAGEIAAWLKSRR